MSIKKYTNIDNINLRTDNSGQFLQSEDSFIVTKNQIEETDFGDCDDDVMEVSVYDINNNLLPQKSGNNVAYIKTGNIKHYLYQITNKGGQKELAIDIEKLLNDLGFTNGILKVNINFVKNRVGTENELTRVWIQEISPSREEIRILPLKTKDENINQITIDEFKNLNNLTKDFKYYRKSILDSLGSYESILLDSLNASLESQFGKDFFNILKKDFGLSKFDDFKKKIFEDFKDSVTYYLNNKYYDVRESNFGKPSEKRFDSCGQYDFPTLTNTIASILYNCVEANMRYLKRRGVDIKELPNEFSVVEMKKDVKNALDAFSTPYEVKRTVYQPDKVDVVLNDTAVDVPIIKEPIVLNPPVLGDIPVDPPPIKVIEPVKETPIVIDVPPMVKDVPTIEQPKVTAGGGRGGGLIPVQRNDTMTGITFEDRDMENFK